MRPVLRIARIARSAARIACALLLVASSQSAFSQEPAPRPTRYYGARPIHAAELGHEWGVVALREVDARNRVFVLELYRLQADAESGQPAYAPWLSYVAQETSADGARQREFTVGERLLKGAEGGSIDRRYRSYSLAERARILVRDEGLAGTVLEFRIPGEAGFELSLERQPLRPDGIPSDCQLLTRSALNWQDRADAQREEERGRDLGGRWDPWGVRDASWPPRRR